MKNRFKLLLLLIIIMQDCETQKETGRKLPAQLDSLFATAPDFSGVVLVAEKGKPIYHRAFGYLNFETKAPLDTSSIFELASISKQFTAMIIMMLWEGGKLNYDDPLENYILGLPYQGITIRHLLNHTSGLPDYQKIMDEHWDKSKPAGNDDIIQYLKQYHPEKSFEPGGKFEYSNTGYVLLASVAEAAAGKDFIALCRDRIFQPLAMNSTDIRTLEEKAAVTNFAPGYIFVSEKQRYFRADSFPSSNYIVWLGNRKGPGRVSSTASDLLRWDRALYTNRLISKETLNDAFTTVRLKNDSISNYGFGWVIETNPKLGKKVSHTGENPGYSTIIVRYIEADKTIVMLNNNNYKGLPDVVKALDSLLSIDPSSN